MSAPTVGREQQRPLIQARASEGNRLAFIDGLRGLAVLLVFFMHSTELFVAITKAHWAEQLLKNVDFGRMGVVVFFAVSGFVIPFSLRSDCKRPVLVFGIGRFFRLFPAFWVSVPFSLVAMQWLLGKTVPLRDVLLNFTMVPRLLDAKLVNGAYWTLEAELAFYGLAALLFCLGVVRNANVLAIVMSAAALVFLSSWHPMLARLIDLKLSGDGYYFLAHISIMFWGACIRQILDQKRVPLLCGMLLILYSGYWILYLPYHSIITAMDGDYVFMRIMSGYSVAMMIFLVVILTKLTWTVFMNWLGRVSYSFYILHGVAIYVTYALALRLPHAAAVPTLVYLLLSFALALALSAASYQYIEQPSIEAGKRLQRMVRSAGVPLRAASAAALTALLARIR